MNKRGGHPRSEAAKKYTDRIIAASASRPWTCNLTLPMKGSREPAKAADSQAIDWLLASDEPGIRMQVRRDLLGEKVRVTVDDILAGPMVRRLLAGQKADGGFGGHPYHKWTGVHWRLVSLVELGVPAVIPAVMAALERELVWFASSDDPDGVLVIRGRPRAHGSIYANALAVAT